MVRTMRPLYKKNNNNYVTVWARPLYKNFNKKKDEEPNKSNNNIRNSMTNRMYINQKQRALKYKDKYLLEFRLFESSSDIRTLFFYTEIAIELLHKTYKQFIKDGVEIPLEPKKMNIITDLRKKLDGGSQYRKTHRKIRKIERKVRHTKRRKY